MAIQIRRGDYDDMDANLLVDGELVATTQDDPNVADGKGFYIKNGTLKRVLTDDASFIPYDLLDTITLDSNSQSVTLFTTNNAYNEYLITIDGQTTSVAGGVYLRIGSTDSRQDTTSSVTYKRVFKITRLSSTEGVVELSSREVMNIDNKDVTLKATLLSLHSGTVIKVYAR